MEHASEHAQHQFPVPPNPNLQKPGSFMFWIWAMGIHRSYVGRTLTGTFQYLIFLLAILTLAFLARWEIPFLVLALICVGWRLIDLFLIFRWKVETSKLPSNVSSYEKSTALLLWCFGFHRLYVERLAKTASLCRFTAETAGSISAKRRERLWRPATSPFASGFSLSTF